MNSYIEEHCFALALKPDFDVPKSRRASHSMRHQRGPPLRRYQRKHGVLLITCLAREINARIQVFQQPPAENQNINVRRLRFPFQARRSGAWLYRLENTAAIRVRLERPNP